MAVSLDTSATTAPFSGLVTSIQKAITIGSGSNQAAVAMLELVDSGGQTGIGVSGGGGSSWTLISGTDSGSGNNERTLIFVATGLATGSQTITASWTTAAHAVLTVVSAFGVNQSTPTQHGTATFQSSVTTLSVTMATASGNMTVSVALSSNGSLTSPNQTTLVNNGADGVMYNLSSGSSTTHQWTSGTNNEAMSGADLIAAAAAAFAPVYDDDLYAMTAPPFVDVTNLR